MHITTLDDPLALVLFCALIILLKRKLFLSQRLIIWSASIHMVMLPYCMYCVE